MATMATMTTEERIAELEQWADRAMSHAEATTARGPESRLAWAMLANALETRALRLMLRDEIREAAWPLKQWAEEMSRPVATITFPEGLTAEQRDEFVQRWNEPHPRRAMEPLASRKAPDPDASPFEQPPAPAGIPYGKDSEEAQAIERVIAEADAERKASDA